jgi:hypothetical protein
MTEFSTEKKTYQKSIPLKRECREIPTSIPPPPPFPLIFTEDVNVKNDHLHTVDKNARSPQ